jgi:hypothetical protein
MNTNRYKQSKNLKLEWNGVYNTGASTYLKPSITYHPSAFVYHTQLGKWFTLLPDNQRFYKLTLENDLQYGCDLLPEPKNIFSNSGSVSTISLPPPQLTAGAEFSFLAYAPVSNITFRLLIGAAFVVEVNTTVGAGLYRARFVKQTGTAFGDFFVERIEEGGHVVLWTQEVPSNAEIRINFQGILELSEPIIRNS